MKYSQTPLHCAAYWGFRECCLVLLENGADKSLKNVRKMLTSERKWNIICEVRFNMLDMFSDVCYLEFGKDHNMILHSFFKKNWNSSQFLLWNHMEPPSQALGNTVIVSKERKGIIVFFSFLFRHQQQQQEERDFWNWLLWLRIIRWDFL